MIMDGCDRFRSDLFIGFVVELATLGMTKNHVADAEFSEHGS